MRVQIAEDLNRFRELQETHGLRSDELFGLLVSLVPGETLPGLIDAGRRLSRNPGEVLAELVAHYRQRNGWTP